MYLLGIDDTDIIGTPGTGSIARGLVAHLAEGGVVARGVTRHQLLFDPRVPYTSHNSSACIHVLDAGKAGPAGLWESACDYVGRRAPKGADPAVCLAEVTPGLDVRALEAFGRSAQTEVLVPALAEKVATETSVRLASLDGTLYGTIGALAAVGLAAGGDDGRCVHLGRIREAGDTETVARILDTGVDGVVDTNRVALDSTETICIESWLRPQLIGRKAILVVEKNDGNTWEPVTLKDRRSRKSGK